MPQITMLIGPICSGKSTYAKHLAKRGDIIINDDALVMALHGGIYNLYNKRIKKLYKAIENNILATAMAMGLDIVIDRPCFKSATRTRYIAIAKTMDYEIYGVVFKRESPEIHARRRFGTDNRGWTYEKWLEVAKYHDSLWEEPEMTEGFKSLLDYDGINNPS